LDELKTLAKNIQNIDLTGVDDIKIGQLAEALSKEMSAF
jgi:hypothetical protein